MKIEILGPGCDRCHATLANAQRAVAELGIAAELVEVKDLMAIIDKGVYMTPGVIIDGEKLSEGRVPTANDIRGWIQARLK